MDDESCNNNDAKEMFDRKWKLIILERGGGGD